MSLLPCYQANVSPHLTEPQIARFTLMLAAFHEGYATLPNSVVRRFNFLMEQMFTVFVTSEELGGDEPIGGGSWLPLDDNLDTGNAKGTPFFPFTERYHALSSDPDQYRYYHGSQPIDGLEEATKAFLDGCKIVDAAVSRDLGIVVGAGTVHLYDLICRKVIQQSGDAVLLPAITYGFFMPQIERSGGRLIFFRPSDAACQKVTAEDIEMVIRRTNQAYVDEWIPSLSHRLQLFLLALANHGLRVANPDILNTLPDRLASCDKDNPAAFDEIIDHVVANELLIEQGPLHQNLHATPRLCPPYPPRVRALLHINPNVFGAVYTEGENRRIADVANRYEIAVIEDLSYNLISLDGEVVRSILPYVNRGYSLIGLSKPFAIANARIGLVLTHREEASDLERFVENSIGFVSTIAQEALKALVTSPQSQLRAYLAWNNLEAEESYLRKRTTLLACLEGVKTPRLGLLDSEWAEATLRREIERFFRWKEGQGIVLLDRGYLRRRLGGGEPEDDEAAYRVYQALVAEAFLREGLRRWFTAHSVPQAGFFLVVDCSALINSSPVAGIPIRGAFDVFALLAYFFGVRTIPEEAMVMIDNPSEVGTLLRLSFSCDIETIVRAMFMVYVGLEQLLAMDVSLIGIPQ